MPGTSPPAVLVIGSLHYDIMVQAPALPRLGETVTGIGWSPKFGGKGGNQALAAARAGVVTRMLGAVGDDGFGAFLCDALRAGGVDAEAVRVLGGRGSGMSVAVTEAGGDYGAVIVSGANAAIAEHWIDDAALWDGVRVLLLQNEVPAAVNLAAARAAHERGALVCLNAAPFRPIDPELARAVGVLIVNAVEAEMLGGGAVQTLLDAERAARALVPDLAHATATAIVTAGGAGAAAVRRDGLVVTVPAEPVEVLSTHGAGDTFVGALAARLARGADLATALRAASMTAALHVATPVG